ncbi:MAG: penicillin acylase family protein, partial [Acidobacteriaceae bacterium]
LQLRAAADRAAAILPPDQLHQLQAYARGVNAYITTHNGASGANGSGGPNTLPVEFHILHYTPALWQPRDSLLIALVMAQDLSTDFTTKLDREALAANLPPNLLPDLYPVGSWRDQIPTQETPNLTTPSAPILQIPLDRTQSSVTTPPQLRHLDPRPGCPIHAEHLGHERAADTSVAFASKPNPTSQSGCPMSRFWDPGSQNASLHPLTLRLPQDPKPSPSAQDDLLRLTADLTNHRCDGCRAGSNNWVVAGTHTATGAPLLSNDMHLGLTAPDIWYEAALHVDTPNGLDVEGFTLPGIPLVIVGRNPYVAWGFTNSGADVQDVLVEHVRTQGKDIEYERPDHIWALVHHHPELIRVRAGRNVHLDVLTTDTPLGNTTIQTPIITQLLPTEHRALALAWTIYDPTTITGSFLAVNSATDANSLVAAFASFTTVSQNLVYADAHHIGYHLLGRIPIRGPAIQHPRTTQTSTTQTLPLTPLPNPNNQADNDDESGDEQTNSSNPQTSSAELPPNPSSRPKRAARSGETPVLPLSNATQTLSPAAAGYTIGSPISPLPVSALDTSQIWSGYIPYNQLPAIQDPTSGIIATANARIVPPNYPYAITDNWADPYRVERIHHLLEADIASGHPLTPADMLRIQTDIHSEYDLLVAQRLAYALDHSAVTKKDKRLTQAANLLRSWNGDVTAPSAAADITSAAEQELWPMLLAPQILAYDNAHYHIKLNNQQLDRILNLYAWGERRTALEQLLQNTPKRWLPPSFTNWNDLLATTVERSLHLLNAPSNLDLLHFGANHAIDIAHPVFGSHSPISTMLGKATGTGNQPHSGDPTTVKAIGNRFGPSERFTADLSNPDNTHANITTGESGNPASPHFLDQFLPWLNGTTFTLPLTHPTIQHTLTLTPQ